MGVAIRTSAGGIGDAVCALYVAAGLKKKFPASSVKFYTHHLSWLQDVVGIELLPNNHFVTNGSPVYDLNHDYNGQLASMVTRKDWYCKAVPSSIEPEQPKLRRTYNPETSKNLIVLAPFSHWKQRDWPLEKWLVLEDRLRRIHGFDTVVVGTPADKDGNQFDYSVFQSELMVGRPAKEVIDAMLVSKCVVGNDSGIPHVSGMYGIPTVAITSQIDASRLFSHTPVKAVRSGWDCSDCGFGHRKPYHINCDKLCSSLASIPSLSVEKAIIGSIKTTNALLISDVILKKVG